MKFDINDWRWKVAVVATLLVMREFVRLISPKEAHGDRGETAKWFIETIDSAAIAIGLVLFVIQPFILQAFFIPSGSMENTLLIGDRLLVSKLVYRLKDPQFQDVIVFKAPQAALMTQSEKNVDFIKRCIGTPGDTVYMIDRKIYRCHGEGCTPKMVPEPYTKWSENVSSLSFTGSPDEGNQNGISRYSYDMKIVGGAVYSRLNNGPTDLGNWSQNDVGAPEANQETISHAKPGQVPAGQYLFLGDHRNNSNDGHVWGFAPREAIVGKAICVFWPPTRLGLVDQMSHPHPKSQP